MVYTPRVEPERIGGNVALAYSAPLRYEWYARFDPSAALLRSDEAGQLVVVVPGKSSPAPSLSSAPSTNTNGPLRAVFPGRGRVRRAEIEADHHVDALGEKCLLRRSGLAVMERQFRRR